MVGNKSMSRYGLPLFVAAMYSFLYLPIFILIIFSFNDSPTIFRWQGFSLHWYYEVFQDSLMWDALYNSIIVALSSVIVTLALSLTVVYFGARMLKKSIGLFYGALIVPEIVIAVGLLSIFSFYYIPRGYTTLIAGHTVLGLGYAVPILYSRFKELNVQLTEASSDLGATITQTFFKVILPMLSPALLAAALLVFIVSLDDFIIAFFCSSSTTQTLPLYIFSVIRAGSSQVVSALSVIFLLAGSLFVLLLSYTRIRKIFFFGG